MVTVALRTRKGLSLSSLTEAQRTHCLKNAQHYLDTGLLVLSDDTLRLTREGLFVSDMIMSDLMGV